MTSRFSISRHEATFSETVAYFTFCIGTSETVDIHRVASALLKAGIAETVGSPATSEVRVAPRYRSLAKSLHQMQNLSRVVEHIDRAEYMKLLARHPTWFFKLVPRGLLRGLRPSKEAEEEEKKLSDMSAQLNGWAQEIGKTVLEEQEVIAAQHAIEAEMLRPEYLAGEPYLRLRLKRSYHWLDVVEGGKMRPKGSVADGIQVDALLLIHRSGVFQFTFALRLPDGLPTQFITDRFYGSSPSIVRSRLSEPVMQAAARATQSPGESRWLGAWEEEIAEGTRWRALDLPGGSSLSELFALYKDATEWVANLEFGEWMCYPLIFLDQLDCKCGSERKWMAKHRNDYVQLVARRDDSERLREWALTRLMPPNTALNLESSVLLAESHGLRITWPGSTDGARMFDSHLYQLILIEQALLQYWQLRLVSERVSRSAPSGKKFRATHRETLSGLQEWHDSSLTSGTARDTADRLMKSWRAEKLHQHIFQTLDQLQQIQAASDASRSARRSISLALVAVVAALLLGLPAVSQTLQIAREVQEDQSLGVLAAPLRALAENPNGPWLLYVAFIGILTGVLAAPALLRWRPPLPLLRSKRAGESWPLGSLAMKSLTPRDSSLSDPKGDPSSAEIGR